MSEIEDEEVALSQPAEVQVLAELSQALLVRSRTSLLIRPDRSLRPTMLSRSPATFWY